MFVFKTAVVGAGIMGGEIAQTLAAADLPVVLKDIDQKFVDQGLGKAREVTQGQLGGLVKKEKITQEQADEKLEYTMGLITGATDYEGLGDVDFVVEAVPSGSRSRRACSPTRRRDPGSRDPASNTSSLSITEMGKATIRPDKVVGFHYFYPASVSPLIEVIEGEETSEETMLATANFARQIRKNPIRCTEEPGFVVNRILNSAASEVWRHKTEIRSRLRRDRQGDRRRPRITPMGPFRLTDMLGLDTVLHVAEHLHNSYGDRFYVSPDMQELVKAGNLGAKTGKGFYEHGGQG